MTDDLRGADPTTSWEASPAAAIFDTDGVITATASVHERAWGEVFDAVLAEHGVQQRPFSHRDYLGLVDGRPRQEGVAAFLGDRGIEVEWGTPEDPPERPTVWGIGARKNERFLAALERGGVRPYPGTVRLVERLRQLGVPTAVISASRNAGAVLDAAGVTGLFDACVDGLEAARLELPGKPDPAVFLEAARRLGVEPARSAVVEDAEAGVRAGRRGRFGLVLGVDRSGDPGRLLAAGAHVVVPDLSEVEVDRRGRWHFRQNSGGPTTAGAGPDRGAS